MAKTDILQELTLPLK